MIEHLWDVQYNEIEKYIQDPMTAAWFNDQESKKSGGRQSAVTSEIIYYWMISLNIPMECQKWHLNRLLTLIRVCEEKNKPPKKMSKNAIMKQNAALNAARKKKLNTRG